MPYKFQYYYRHLFFQFNLLQEIHPFARFQDGPAACTNPVPTEWVKKFEVKTEPEVILLKGGQNVKFLVNLDVIKEIPEGSFLGVEVFGSGKLGRLPCIPVSVSSLINAIIFHFHFQIISIK